MQLFGKWLYRFNGPWFRRVLPIENTYSAVGHSKRQR